MSNNARDKAAQEEHFADIFARLREQDIEQFYAHYQLWVLRRRVPLLEKQLETLREHLAEHQQTTEALRPSALALAVLVRLQSNGVSDTDILDTMLNRGEDWLDRMMQRLDYCEQVEDFIQGDYTQWCVKSLDGAYDWIDSLLGSIKEERSPQEKGEQGIIATEELLLQKLSQDDEEAMLGVTFTRPADAHRSESVAAPSASTAAPSEQLALTDETLLESEANEQFPEPPGWKDLEDLEAPATDPAPWYSVGVTENGASLTDDAGQAASMNDWIQVLHAETAARTEADATADAVAQLPSTDQPAEEPDALSISPDSTAVEATEMIQSQETTSCAEAEIIASAENESEPTTDETLAGIDESVPVIAEQTGSADTLLIEDETISIGEEQPLVTTSAASTDEAASIADEDIAHTEATTAPEATDAQTALVDPTAVEVEETDTAEAQIAAEETTLTEAEPVETSEDEAPSADLPGSAAEQNEPDHASEAESGNEIETAAILNDILSIEGEQEEPGEQMAWYEFLALEESASDSMSNATAEQMKPEVSDSAAPQDPQASEATSAPEVIDLQASEASSELEIYEYAGGEEAVRTQSTPQQAGEDAGEIEGWQTWQSDESNEETLPFALKDLQPGQPVRNDGAQEAEVSAISAEQDGTEKAEVIDNADAEEQSTVLSTGDAASDLTAPAAVDSDEISMDSAPASTEDTHIIAHETSIEMIADTDVRVTTDDLEIVESHTSEVSAISEAEEHAETLVSEPTEPTDLQGMSELNVYATFAEAEASAQAEKPLSGWNAPTALTLPELTAESAQSEEAAESSTESVFVLEGQQITRDEVSKIETVVEQVAVHVQVEEPPRAQAAKVDEKPPKKPGFWRRLFRFGKKHEG